MDRSLTSTSKSTPFSINDILTKNNTTIFRRSNSSGHLSPIDTKFSASQQYDGEQSDEPASDLSQHLSHSMRFVKYSPHHGYEHDNSMIEYQSQLQRTSQHYSCNNNNNSVSNNNGKNGISASELKAKRNGHLDKSVKPLRFYNFPLMLEQPMDMRRCVDEGDDEDDDSGERTRRNICSLFVVVCDSHGN